MGKVKFGGGGGAGDEEYLAEVLTLRLIGGKISALLGVGSILILIGFEPMMLDSRNKGMLGACAEGGEFAELGSR